MGDITDLNNPSFAMFPFATHCTAWQRFGLPMILCVPHVRDLDGNPLANSYIIYDGSHAGVRIYIAGAGSTIAPVAGPDHRGIFNPDIELYSIDVTAEQLLSRKVTVSDGTIISDTDGTQTITLQTRSGVIGKLTYLAHADYYDLSDILLDVEQLPPGQYVLVYEAKFFFRRVSDTGRLVCFDSTATFTRSRFDFSHPGEVLLQVVNQTPGLYFTKTIKSQDTTIQFYRPFAEVFQDLYDEQAYLKKLNWVFDVAPEHIPYLGFLLGWDIPYFPESIDSLRKAVLRNMVRLQKLKGTKRAVRELFDLFGFSVTINNVWWSPDGKKYVGPGESAAYPVTLTPTATYEPLLLGFNTDGYGQLTVPLINRPTVLSASIESFLVERGSEAESDLLIIKGILDTEPDAISDSENITILNRAWIDVQPTTAGMVGYTRLNLDSNGIATVAESVGWPIHSARSVRMNYRTNVLNLSFSRNVDFTDDNLVAYAFISYQYEKLSVPDNMQNLQSNRFDVAILGRDGGDVRPDVVDFLVDFLFQIKAFHSLLRKILYDINVIDVYQVTDFCVGGLITQDPNKAAGKQQVPPEAIIPHIPTDPCEQLDPLALGYRPQDIRYRNTVLTGLNIEFEGWKALGPNCQYTHKGQDKVTDGNSQDTGAANGEMIYSQSQRATVCDTNGRDYCYKGRVDDTMFLHDVMTSSETWRFRICGLSLGAGVYFTIPTTGITDQSGRFKGGLLGKYIADYRNGEDALHYADGFGFNGVNIDPNKFKAFRRPSLEIQKDNLTFPGHRLPNLGNLLTDYTSSEYDLRPWDINLQCTCMSADANPLNAHIYIGTDGTEYIGFDKKPYTLAGNGQKPDISSLGMHVDDATDASDVTHAIYMTQATSHPAITLQGVVEGIGIATVGPHPIFKSAVNCEGDVKDLSDGYPAISGWLNLSGSTEGTDLPQQATGGTDIYRPVYYFPSITDRNIAEELREEMGIPPSQSTPSLLFTVSSMIRVPESDFQFERYIGQRLDCGCIKLICGTGTAEISSVLDCTISQFLDDFGDVQPDQMTVNTAISLPERMTAATFQLNDPHSSLFNVKRSLGSEQIVTDKGFPGDTPFPDDGSFTYKDDYGIIYEIMWETLPDKKKPVSYLDFVTVKKDPRRLGISSDAGRVKNRQLYADGTVSITRQLFTNKNDGTIVLTAEGYEESFNEFQSTFLCGKQFVNPFVNQLDTPITEEIDGLVDAGPHWADPDLDNTSAEDTWWADVDDSAATTGGRLTWIDVFGA